MFKLWAQGAPLHVYYKTHRQQNVLHFLHPHQQHMFLLQDCEVSEKLSIQVQSWDFTVCFQRKNLSSVPFEVAQVIEPLQLVEPCRHEPWPMQVSIRGSHSIHTWTNLKFLHTHRQHILSKYFIIMLPPLPVLVEQHPTVISGYHSFLRHLPRKPTCICHKRLDCGLRYSHFHWIAQLHEQPNDLCSSLSFCTTQITSFLACLWPCGKRNCTLADLNGRKLQASGTFRYMLLHVDSHLFSAVFELLHFTVFT